MTSACIIAAWLLAGPWQHELYRAQVAASESAARLGEHAEARIWLDATPASLRGFEWRAHDAAADESLLTWTVDEGSPTSLAVSPRGDRLAVGTTTGALLVLDAATGAPLLRIAAHAEALTDVRFDSSGSVLATCSYDRLVKLWNADTLALRLEFTGHEYPVGGVVLAPDLSWAASSSYRRPPGTVEGIVHVWDPKDGTILRTLVGGRKPLVDLALGPDGSSLFAASWDFCAFGWPGGVDPPVKMPFPDEGIYNGVDGVAISPDGRFVAACGKDQTARVFEAATGALVATLRGHVDAVAKVSFSPDGGTLATAAADGTVRLWGGSGFESLAILRGHGDDVLEVVWSPDGSRLFSASQDGTVRTWDARTSRYGGVRFETTGPAYVVRFNPAGTQLAVATFDGRVEIRDATTWERLRSFQAHDQGKSCHALDWTPDGRQLLTGSHDGTVRLFDAATGEQQASFLHENSITWLRVSRDGHLVAACSGNVVTVTDLATRERLHAFTGHAKAVLGVAFSPDSAWCASTARDGSARTWRATTGEPGIVIDAGTDDVSTAVYTPDGRGLVVIGRNGLVRLHAARTGRLVRVLLAGRHEMTHAALSPDGTRLALASDCVRIVDLAHGGQVGEVRPHAEHPYHVDFDPSGERLASCATDGTVAVTDTVPLRVRLEQVRERSGSAR